MSQIKNVLKLLIYISDVQQSVHGRKREKTAKSAPSQYVACEQQPQNKLNTLIPGSARWRRSSAWHEWNEMCMQIGKWREINCAVCVYIFAPRASNMHGRVCKLWRVRVGRNRHVILHLLIAEETNVGRIMFFSHKSLLLHAPRRAGS